MKQLKRFKMWIKSPEFKEQFIGTIEVLAWFSSVFIGFMGGYVLARVGC